MLWSPLLIAFVCHFFWQLNGTTVKVKYFLTADKVSWFDPHTGAHSSTQVGRVNQWMSGALWDWISVWRLGSDGAQISYFHRQAHFRFCRLRWALTVVCLFFHFWPRFHCQWCFLKLIFTITVWCIWDSWFSKSLRSACHMWTSYSNHMSYIYS